MKFQPIIFEACNIFVGQAKKHNFIFRRYLQVKNNENGFFKMETQMHLPSIF